MTTRQKPLERVALCYVGDARNNTANSLLVTGALLGMDVRIARLRMHLLPSQKVQALAEELGARSDARITIGDDNRASASKEPTSSTPMCGFRWASRPSDWDERIKQMLPYQVNADLMAATGNPEVKFMHCLPAIHNPDTELGQQLHDKWGLTALEVTDEVFESPASIVFDQAENRLHTIKAAMVATIGS